MKELDYIPNNTQLDLTDRVAIEVGLARKESFAQIAKTLKKHPHTISREVHDNRTHMPSEYPFGNDCRWYPSCTRRNLCGADEYACSAPCKKCKEFNCNDVCEKYDSMECRKTDKPPYVCNTCYYRTICKKNRYYYNAKYADAAVKRRRSVSRSGARVSDEELRKIGAIIRPLLRKGQPLAHIYAEHEKELPVGLRTLHNYIDQGHIRGVKNIDLRRKVGYKARRKKRGSVADLSYAYREGRTYADYETNVSKYFSEYEVVEMDTVKGRREKGEATAYHDLQKEQCDAVVFTARWQSGISCQSV